MNKTCTARKGFKCCSFAVGHWSPQELLGVLARTGHKDPTAAARKTMNREGKLLRNRARDPTVQ
eukprot:12528472-Alexandrium_andersonii.AAC.1